MGSRARIAVVGAGWWAVEHHIPNLLRRADEAEVVGVSRLGAEELAQVRDRFAIPFASEDFREVIAATRPDGVVVASPHVAHFENAKAALEAGAHVLVEKPMTTSAAQARELAALAERQGLQIMIPHGWNFTRFMPEAARLVAGGGIGRLRHFTLQMGTALMDLFGGQPMEETAGHMFQPPPSTWADPARAGGYGWGQLSHALGALFRIVPHRPVDVFARTGLSPAGVDAFDAAVVALEDGVTGTLSGSAGVPKHRSGQVDLRLFGDDGMLLLDLERERLELRRHDRRDQVAAFAPGEGATAYSTREPIDRFVDLCLGRPVANDADASVGLRTVEVLDAMYRSAASGRLERV